MSEKYKIRDQDSLYFITFAVVRWVDVFTRLVYRELMVDSIKHCQDNKGLMVFSWCLMSNHIHMIVGRKRITKIEDIIRDFKKFTSVHICRAIESNLRESRKDWMLRIFSEEASKTNKHQKYCFWQNTYHPIELFDNEIMDQKLKYVHQNPVKAGIVSEPEHYLYSSASNYAGLGGLIDVKFIE